MNDKSTKSFIFCDKSIFFQDMPSLEGDTIEGKYFLVYYTDLEQFFYGVIPSSNPTREEVIIYSCTSLHEALEGIIDRLYFSVDMDSHVWDFTECICRNNNNNR